MTNTDKPTVVHQIPVDQIDFSPNISSDAENFFQSDADIARMAARQGMVNYDKGQAIKLPSKVLDICQGIVPVKSTAEISGDKDLKDATLFLAESGHVARKISAETGKTIKLFQGHTGPVTRVAVYQTQLGQERLVTGSWDKTIRVWDTETKECLATLKGHTDFVKALTVRTVVLTEKDQGLGQDRDEQGKEKKKKKRIGHELFSASYDGTIMHWDLQTFEPFQGGAGGPWKGHVRGVNDLCLTVEEDNDERADDDNEEEGKQDRGKEYLYSAGSDSTIRKWDIAQGQGRGGHCVHVFEHHETTVYKVIVAGVEIWSTSADKTARRLDLETKKVDMRLEHPDFVKSIALAGPYVITGGRQETVRVWSVATGKLIKEISGHFDEVSSMVVIGSTLFTGSLDGTVRRWSLKEQDLIAPVAPNENEGTAIAAEPRSSNTPSVAKGSSKEEEAAKSSMMTEEEERELAELMGSDDDD
ncbi:WD40-repeat-containing domain protein [Gamsiella multidivaricata]|uniref:WD40-repeat-containing domain protein n=1 Tax=Gamsiella multidivaricata TaxID=101098 RepID=UPI00221FD175|nr:WD40-repeat-containing domain protein [Gamsiella multidivaricata]KAG0356767.1 hypothetical protein BGZ54_000612 [Gamsiella multidivaricata]KAI7816211.1 WD40-repeat-containing domain protein [Gamsiella multidivaricata]